MKKFGFVLVVMVSVAVMGCSEHKKERTVVLPAPGTVIDSVSEKVKEDTLNKSRFTVVVTADSQINNGVYHVKATLGAGEGNGQFVMPKGLDHYTLSIKKGTTAYTYVIGFRLQKDTTFREYLQVTGTKSSIGMKYLKTYTFE